MSDRKKPASQRIRRWSRLLLTFVTGQALIQGLNALTGLLLLRWMSVTSYAQYSATFAFQSSLTMLVDLGFNNSVVPLVGDRGRSPEIVGKYVRTVRSLRLRSLIVVGAVSAIAFPLVMRNQQWPWPVKTSLWAAVIAAIFFSMNDVYRAPLLINQQIGKLYRTDVVPAVVRITLSYSLYLASALVGWVAAWFSALNYLQTALMLRKAAQPYVKEPPAPDPEVSREIIQYLTPLWPGMVYYAFQGQIAIGLISYFGQTSSIAETAALGRLGLILMFLGSGVNVLLMPIVARTNGRKLALILSAVVASLTVLLTELTVLAFLVPGPFLFLLGHHYNTLGKLIGPVILYASLNFMQTSLYTIAVAKKWIGRRIAWLPIIFVVSVQVTFLCFSRVSQTAQAVNFQIATGISGLSLWVLVVARRLPREFRLG